MNLKSIDHILIKVDQDYNNEKDLGGVKLVVNIAVDNMEFVNREATVIDAPKGMVIQKGDKVIVHHNIIRTKNDVRGNQIKTEFHVQDNIYWVPFNEVFMYKRGEDWIALDPYCFVEPIDIKRPEKIGGLILPNNAVLGHKNRVSNQATVKYTNQELEESGVVEGTKVITKKYAEYEFVVDGKLMYRVKTSSVLAVIE